jgi:nicotinate-nucleotide adenylyltransferase
VADGRRIVATGIEAALRTTFTIDTLAALRRRFPRTRFVFVIGADNLAQLPRWAGWARLVARTPLAVLPRPGWTRRALAGQAAKRLARHRRRPGALLAGPPPAHAPWAFVPAAEHPASATAIRAGLATPPVAAKPRGAAAVAAVEPRWMQSGATAAR